MVNKLTPAANPEQTMSTVPTRILLGPGPSMVHPNVLQAMMSGMIGYLDPDFLLIMDEVSDLLKRVFQTNNNLTMTLSGTGSAGMEAGFNSLLEPGDTVIHCVSGFFSERMLEMSGRVGAKVVPLRADWGRPFPEEMLEKELAKHTNVKLITAIQAETSTGIKQPLSGLSKLAKEHDSLFMVDAVTSLGGNEVAVDEWNIDYCYSASQKCLASPPGLSPVSVSPEALEVVKTRTKAPTSWYLDLWLNANYWAFDRVYHHTAPTSMIYALRESLKLVLQEGLEKRYQRHHRNAVALWAGLEALNLELVAEEKYRLDQITPVWIPEGIDDDEVRKILLREYNIEIGKGLGQFAGRVWRIGLMGESSKAQYVMAVLSALEEILSRLGYEVPYGAGVAAASRSLSSN